MKNIYLIGFLFFGYTIVLAQDNRDENVSKGNEFYKQNEFELAERKYREALEGSPNNYTAQYNLANALAQQKKYDEAIKVLQQLTTNVTDNKIKSEAFYNKGVSHTKLKDLEGSIEAYKNALRINPDDKEARENLQKALLEQKKQKQQQQQKDQQKKQQPKMSEKEAEQKLKQLQEREKRLQQKLNTQKGKGVPMSKDW